MHALQVCGLAALISVPEDSAAPPVGEGSPVYAAAAEGHEHLVDSTRFEIHELAETSMQARLVGRPQALADCSFEAADSTALRLSHDTVALGVGAFGGGFDECRELYGDFLAAAGGAVVQPGSIGMRCDHLLAEGACIPEMRVLYSLVCTGQFSRLLRFEPADDADRAAPSAQRTTNLGTLIEKALAAADATAVCMLLVAESAGLVGAGLRRSPAASGAAGTRMAQFPQVRDWLSLAVERLDAGSTVVALGVVAEPASVPEHALAFLRPLHRDMAWHAHLHAAPFRYRALPCGRIKPAQVVPALFDSGSASTVLHLLGDDRDPSQIQDSHFVRGACWVAPLDFSQVRA